MDLSNLTIKSRNPMYYIDDEYQIIEIPNVYDDEEVIEIKTGDVTVNRVPINKRITVLTSFGMFLFRSKDDALNFGRMLDKEGKQSLVKSSESQSITKENITSFSSNPTKNGLYSIKELDDGLLGRKDGYCYLDNDEIKQVPQIIQGSNEDLVLTEFVNRKSKLDSINLANNKVIFEILYENGKSYVTYYTVDSNSINNSVLFTSDLNSYKVFDSKFNARTYRSSEKHFGSYYNMDHNKETRENYETYMKKQQVKKETTIKVFKILGGFIWNYKGVIIEKGMGLLKKLITKEDSEGHSEIQSKIIDMIMKGEVNFV